MTLDEVLLKAETTFVGEELGRDGVVAHGQQRHLDAMVLCEFPSDLGLRGALGETLAAIEVGREVAVSQAKPGGATEFGEFVHDPPGLAAQPPPQFVVVQTGEGVGDRVEVRADR